MGHLLSTMVAAVGVFAGTDIDDIIVLTVLFLASRVAGRPTKVHLIAGQYLGIAALVAVSAIAAAGVLSVAAVTIANGADNLSVYIPLFRTIGLGDSLLTVAVFAVMVAVWLAAAFWLGSHKRVVALVERFGHWLVPVVFVAIGALILIRSGPIAHAS